MPGKQVAGIPLQTNRKSAMSRNRSKYEYSFNVFYKSGGYKCYLLNTLTEYPSGN